MIPLLILIVTLIPAPAFALNCDQQTMAAADAIPCFFGTLSGFAAKLLNIGLGAAGIISVVVLIYGGVQYMGGNKSARPTILAAIVGLVIVIMAYAIVNGFAAALSQVG